ncbi:Ppx/GppA phosphatase family protein [Rudaeicoccus suwonensis]|uniref:Exopolyphosphatase/guanosine-5'-triphosphate, 3'-diphosphate pyrophosphatase n=1 Tax=Rudaeicoccus suwonensis TaxID=657409 RepID=A0A561DU82_9MICO|nr:Ppx/GppA phosphatase family protein [Rudaeicoccus suwonensis]TWE06919.1 exopolyphosphatase/guanosine-5'-triphosphate,3'-diphosphate pyrophosphatase [Rudaeicoccus suwonensis]
MRLGVIDVGSNTVHLLVVDAHRGAHPLPASSHKRELRLSEHTEQDGSIAANGIDRLTTFVGECLTIAEDQGIEDLLAFATSAIREAPNGEAVLQQVRDRTGVDLQVLSGPEESRLTFLAVRRWFGWSAGRLMVLDIGGGSLEFAAGIDEEPDAALSLPLGAGRLTRELPGDPPGAQQIRAVRKQIRSDIARVVRDLAKVGVPDRIVGTSKTIRSLARLCGAAPSGQGPYVDRSLDRSALAELVPQLSVMSAAERAELPGVSVSRSRQLLAGAIVVEAAMDLLDVPRLDLCPWALREGVILRRLDWLDS